MNSLRAIIVDDEPLCRQDLRDVLLGFPHIQICGEAANTTQAIALINENMPDKTFRINANSLNGLIINI